MPPNAIVIANESENLARPHYDNRYTTHLCKDLDEHSYRGLGAGAATQLEVRDPKEGSSTKDHGSKGNFAGIGAAKPGENPEMPGLPFAAIQPTSQAK